MHIDSLYSDTTWPGRACNLDPFVLSQPPYIRMLLLQTPILFILFSLSSALSPFPSASRDNAILIGNQGPLGEKYPTVSRRLFDCLQSSIYFILQLVVT